MFVSLLFNLGLTLFDQGSPMGFLAAYTPYMKDVQNKKQGTHLYITGRMIKLL
ncbi:hypothetical protein C248_1672 [Staphylococcus aureus 08BA02176]|nr:hypothetical protein C248_1672 [Staphylococcus aureus 08BA02176]CRI16417.1 conserved hypothetical protein [Staphylococcus aureus]CRI16565.1 conserved hypothetical protein [Staphylococcus aureus]CRI23977.1 conserved hypothetical protein [Staphylococcus aureus]